jgi:serine/threonine-protein kinase
MILARDFKVVRPLASGGMGSVYLVEQMSTGRQRALKVMHPEYARDQQSRERFTQEARAGARIRSEHVVEVVSAGVDDDTGIPWLAMELLDGEELSERMKRLQRLPPSDVLEIFKQLCHGLGEAHRTGLIHRDLKPENIFVAASRRQNVPFTVKILDFGVAKLALENATQMDGTRPVGTPRWMAPEQSEHNGHVTPATDVWALGLIAFYLLTGRYYWRSANARDGKLTTLLRELVLEPIEFASKRAAFFDCAGAIPPGFDAWFARCVVREPAERFQNADEALVELVPVLESAVPWDGPLPEAPYASGGTGTSGQGVTGSGDGATLSPGSQATPNEGVTLQRPAAGLSAPGVLQSNPSAPTLRPIPREQGATGARAKTGAARPLPGFDPGAIDAGALTAPPSGRFEPPQPRPAPAQPAPAAVAAPAAPEAKKSGPPVVAIVVVAALVLGGVGLAVSRGKRAEPAAAPVVAPKQPAAQPPAPAKAPEPVAEQESFTLLLESLPEGADVIDASNGDKKLGTTPLMLTLVNAEVRKQPRSFRVEKTGYRPFSVLQGPSSDGVRITAPLAVDDSQKAAPKPGAGSGSRERPKKSDEPELRLRR